MLDQADLVVSAFVSMLAVGVVPKRRRENKQKRCS